MLQRLIHKWFGWHFFVWELPQDDHDTCWICGAKRGTMTLQSKVGSNFHARAERLYNAVLKAEATKGQ